MKREILFHQKNHTIFQDTLVVVDIVEESITNTEMINKCNKHLSTIVYQVLRECIKHQQQKTGKQVNTSTQSNGEGKDANSTRQETMSRMTAAVQCRTCQTTLDWGNK